MATPKEPVFLRPPKQGDRWSDLDHCKQDDDLLSYFFVDLGFFRKKHDEDRRISRKFNREGFTVNKSVKWDNYLEIIKMVKSGDLEPRQGSRVLLKTGTFKTLLKKKRTTPQYNHLVEHTNRYMELWRPDCPFKLFETRRYLDKAPKGRKKTTEDHNSPSEAQPIVAPIATPEILPPAFRVFSLPTDLLLTASQASSSCDSAESSTSQKPEYDGPPLDLGVKARKAFQVHEHLRLFGSAADITEEIDEEMRMDEAQLKADFSVLYNASKRCFQLFLGPGRFVNHDCDPNVELIRSGRGLCFKVIRPIEPGDEIFTFYGSEYFGPGNENCRCDTCKRNRRGHFAPVAKPAKKKQKVVEEDPNARRTRSGRVVPNLESLRKKVHRANLAKTKVVIQEGTRRSARSSTQQASQASLQEAVKSGRRLSTSASTRKRVRDADDTASETGTSTVQSKRQKTQVGDGFAVMGSDSDLTDIDDLGIQQASNSANEAASTETSTSTSPAWTDAWEDIPNSPDEGVLQATSPNGLPDKQPCGSDDSRMLQGHRRLMSASIPVVEGEVPSPLGGGTPLPSDMTPPPPSSNFDSQSPSTPTSFSLAKMRSGLSSTVKALLSHAMPSSPHEVSDTTSQSQASVIDPEEESVM